MVNRRRPNLFAFLIYPSTTSSIYLTETQSQRDSTPYQANQVLIHSTTARIFRANQPQLLQTRRLSTRDMSAPLPTMPDSWHLEPPHRSHGHHLSSDPWDTNSPAGSSTPIPIPTHYPDHPAAGPGIHDALGALARNTSSDRRKGKEREREVMELVRYEAPVRFAVMGDMMDTSKGRDKVLVSLTFGLLGLKLIGRNVCSTRSRRIFTSCRWWSEYDHYQGGSLPIERGLRRPSVASV